MRFWPRTILIFSLFLVALYACRKKDEVFPKVEILQPAENAAFQVFDTIHVSFSVSDETELVSVTVQLINSDLIPAGAQQHVAVPSSSFSGSADLIISDKLLPSGVYYVEVAASDGPNEEKAFQKITVNALHKQRKAIYCALASGTISKVDSLFQGSSPWLQLGHDLKKMVVNSLKDRLTCIGNYSTEIASYNIGSASQVWSDNAFFVSQVQRYTDLLAYKNDIYVGWYDQEVRSYSLSGSLGWARQTGNYRPELIYADDNYLVIEMELLGANDHFIFVYQATTKALLWQMDIPMDVKSICGFDENEVVLFGNDNGNAKVLLYDMSNNSWWQPRQLPVGEVITATKMEGKTYAISHQDGIYAYTYSPNYLNLIKSGGLYQDVSYDEDKGTLIAATGNTLEEMSIQGQLLGTVVQPDSIVSFDIHYTR
ncbi:MAG: hypothetical protein GC178_15880 [Flavobacteriales bacterium]|nr:hypothetical protein [Flavobacteriales bacterium]